MNKPKKIEALFISDVHLGSKGCNADKLLVTLKKYHPEYLFIVGDFIDGWLLKKRHYWTQDYTNVIRKILSLSKKGTKVIYITGNHDEFLREYSISNLSGNIQIVDEWIWKDYYIVHGDLYDGIMNMKWLAHLGSWGYEIAIKADRFLKRLGHKRSISKWAKDSVKSAVKFITAFENQLIYEAKKRGCKGVICGHIHKPENTFIDGIHYLNCGDWIENNSYIIYRDNKFISLTYESSKM
jgi:UDP-2,3-diacylglucosamine pyrophosphatase LpxH